MKKASKDGLSSNETSAEVSKRDSKEKHVEMALERMSKSSGIKDEMLSERVLCQVGQAMLLHWQPKERGPELRLEVAANAIAEMQPINATEALLAAQMLAVNDAVFLLLSQATLDSASRENRSLFAEQACKFLEVFIRQTDAMQRLKGKTGQQKVTVEHVTVNQGGQAIVGTVENRKPGGDHKNEG